MHTAAGVQRNRLKLVREDRVESDLRIPFCQRIRLLNFAVCKADRTPSQFHMALSGTYRVFERQTNRLAIDAAQQSEAILRGRDEGTQET